MTQRKIVLLALLLAVCRTERAAATQLALQQIGRAEDPVAITHAGDSRLFITEQRGRVMVHDGTTVLPVPFLDIRSIVRSPTESEQGLLSVAFHPNYHSNGFFFVNYTDLGGDTVVARYSVSATDANRADPNSARIILQIDQPYANHNGGQLQFGPDRYLYIGMGDGGAGGDPENRAQNLGSLLGKVLRIDVDREEGSRRYAIPSSNPLVDNYSARGEIWALGLRNPWRFTFDRLTGDMFIGDVGQGEREEIDFQPGTSTGGENYGWRRMEGTRCYNPSTNCNTGNLVLPILEYRHTQGCSVTGGYRYRGADPRLRGVYLYGDFCGGQIWGATQDVDGAWSTEVLLQTNIAISTFGEDVNGELYVADHGGPIYKILEVTPPARRRAVRR
jgi:glucose/sorbosone dehydrogenase